MPQTLQVLAAVFILGLLSLSIGRSSSDERRGHGRAEAEHRALGVATSILDQLAALPYDGAGTVADPSEFTAAADFGGGDLSPGGASDLDDVNGSTITVSVAPDGVALPFDVATAVQYVEPVLAGGVVSFAPAAGRTYYKEVVIAVVGPLGTQVELRRVRTYAPPSP